MWVRGRRGSGRRGGDTARSWGRREGWASALPLSPLAHGPGRIAGRYAARHTRHTPAPMRSGSPGGRGVGAWPGQDRRANGARAAIGVRSRGLPHGRGAKASLSADHSNRSSRETLRSLGRGSHGQNSDGPPGKAAHGSTEPPAAAGGRALCCGALAPAPRTPLPARFHTPHPTQCERAADSPHAGTQGHGPWNCFSWASGGKSGRAL